MVLDCFQVFLQLNPGKGFSFTGLDQREDLFFSQISLNMKIKLIDKFLITSLDLERQTQARCWVMEFKPGLDSGAVVAVSSVELTQTGKGLFYRFCGIGFTGSDGKLPTQPLPVQFHVSLELDFLDQISPDKEDLDPYSITSGFDADLHIVKYFGGEEALDRAFGLRGAVGLPFAQFHQVEKVGVRDVIQRAVRLNLDALNDLAFEWGIGSKRT